MNVIINRLKLRLASWARRRSAHTDGRTGDAVAVIPVRRQDDKIRVFMPQRDADQRHFPGYHLFPWDILRERDQKDPEKTVARILQTHAGFHPQAPTPLGEALTVDLSPYRYRTRFYLVECRVQPGAPPPDSPGGWQTPAHYLRLYGDGRLLTLPTVPALLTEMVAADTVPTDIGPTPHDDGVPRFEPLSGLHQLMPLSHTFPPIGRTNCFVISDSAQGGLIVDPSPLDRREYGRLIISLEQLRRGFGDHGMGYHGIFLTHHHVDHHLHSPRLARELGVPVLCSPYTHRRIMEKHGKNYFDGVGLRYVAEGDVVAHWQGRAVRVHELPGHDEGQLGLAPDGTAWFLVGDLIQGVGTVVVTMDEGDMGHYFGTLERVLRLNPRVLLPSHGLPLGGTVHLRDTLKHRRMREQQILKLHHEGNSAEAMVPLIYRGLHRRLLPFALENIKSHLQKLKNDGLLDGPTK